MMNHWFDGRDVMPRMGTGSESGRNRFSALADADTAPASPRGLVEAGVEFRASDDVPQRRSPDPTVPDTPAGQEPLLQTTFAMDDDDTESVASRNSGHDLRDGVAGTANRIRRLRAQDLLPEVRTAATLIRSLAARVGPVPTGGNLPSAIRRQRWSPLNVPLMWAAAGHQESCPLLEWLISVTSGMEEPIHFIGEV